MPYAMNAVISLFEINCGIMTLLLMNDLSDKLEANSSKPLSKLVSFIFQKLPENLSFFLAVSSLSRGHCM